MNIYVVQDSDRMAHCERSTSRSTSRLELWECGTDEVTKHNTVHMDVCTYLWVYTYGWMYHVDVNPSIDGFTSTWTDGVNVLYLHTSWSGEGLHWN